MAMFGKPEDLAALAHPSSRLKRALQLLQDLREGRVPGLMEQISALEPGQTIRVPVEDEAIYALLQCYEPRARAQGRFEAHAQHTDLQFVVAGRECIEVCDARTLFAGLPYDEKGNAYQPIGDRKDSRLVLSAGTVAVLSPGDAHAPCLTVENTDEQLVRKVVVKVKDAHLLEPGAAAWTWSSGNVAAAIQ